MTRKAKPAPRIARSSQPAASQTRHSEPSRQTRAFQVAKDKARKTGDMRDAGDAINRLLERQARRTSRR